MRGAESVLQVVIIYHQAGPRTTPKTKQGITAPDAGDSAPAQLRIGAPELLLKQNSRLTQRVHIVTLGSVKLKAHLCHGSRILTQRSQ